MKFSLSESYKTYEHNDENSDVKRVKSAKSVYSLHEHSAIKRRKNKAIYNLKKLN